MEGSETRVCVVDTDVLIDVLKQRPPALRRLEELRSDFLVATTTYSFFELFYGAYAQAGTAELEKVFSLSKELPALPLSLAAARRAGMIQARLEKAGSPLPPADVVIAAIALENDAAVHTRNVKHFSKIAEVELV